LENNTTAHLVADMEMLREHLRIDRWLLFGASWGSTLGLTYAVEHPERVSEMVLWAVVTTRSSDVTWVTRTMGEVYPEEFDRLLGILAPEERSGNVAAAVLARLRSDDRATRDAAALAWCAWEDRIATLSGPVTPHRLSLDPRDRLGFARLVTHYFAHHAFQADDAILGRLERIRDLPAYLLRGRLDIASPLRPAYEIASRLPNATLDIVEADAHGAGDDTLRRLVAALDEYAGTAH
jgi:proline iminopeptidase